MNQELISGARTQAEVGMETRALYDVLCNLKPGESISYEELNKAAGRDVQTEARGSLGTARKMCQREHQMVFSPVRGEGLRRLTDGEIVDGADSDIARIRRTARRGAAKLACATYDNLEQELKPVFNAKAAIFGTLVQHSLPAQVRQITKHYANDAKPVLPKA